MTDRHDSASEDLVEQDWEAEIGRLFQDLPIVEPPEGFLESALDRRPLYAGRTFLVAGALSVAAVVLVSVSGLLRDQTFVPDLEALVSRHSTTEASIFGSVVPSGGSEDHVFRLLEDPAPVPMSLPSHLEWEASFAGEDLEQAVFASGDGAVSVFIESGNVDFDSLPAGGVTDIEGVRVWVDPTENLVIVQASDSVVTVVGLDPELLGDVVAGIETSEDLSAIQRLAAEVNRTTRQLGFPDLGG